MELNRETVTAFSSIIAAATGLWTVFLNLRLDRTIVIYGTDEVRSPLSGVTVENRSKEPINLLDWGLVQENGHLFSLRDCEDDHMGVIDYRYVGTPTGLQPRKQFIHGVLFDHFGGPRIVGAYAITTAQWFPRLALTYTLPWLKRLQITAKVWCTRSSA